VRLDKVRLGLAYEGRVFDVFHNSFDRESSIFSKYLGSFLFRSVRALYATAYPLFLCYPLNLGFK